MEESIELKIQLNEADYKSFLVASLKARGMKRSMWMFGIYALVVAILAVMGSTISGEISYSAFIPLAIFVFLLSLLLYEINIKSKRIFRNDSALNQPYSLEIDNTGIAVKRKENFWNVGWAEVFDFMVTDKSILIYVSPAKVIIIPERFIQTALQVESLSNLLQEKILVRKASTEGSKSMKVVRIIILVFVVIFILLSLYRSML